MTPTRPDPIAYLTGQLSGARRPEAVTETSGGGKFTPVGAALPFPGNTVICHVLRHTRAWAALGEMQSELRDGPHAHHFTFLPPESFHMTIFGCVSGPRGEGRPWPRDLPETAALDTVTETLLSRLRRVEIDCPIRARPVGLFGGYSVTMQGLDDRHETALRRIRRRMRDATDIHEPNFEGYVFHITLAYLVSWLEATEAREVVALSDRLFSRFATDIDEVPLGPVEFCKFETMHSFELVERLGPISDEHHE